MKKIIYIYFLLLGSVSAMQAQETFATVELSRRSVYPGEPFQLNVTCYTSTYFLSAISFADFRVPNAFTLSFSRTLSGITKIKGKSYATLQFFMLVYPLESGLLEIPSIELSFQSPPEGDYKKKAQLINTKPQNITVKPIPQKTKVIPWFVANSVVLSDRWNKRENKYKVGDVLERNVLVKAFGTLPYYIPELNYDENEGLEIYPKTADLLDKRNDEQAIGWKTQRVLYLLTQEGEITIPELEINWFNPLTNRAVVSTILAKTLQVLPNKDMGMLTSIRDSLAVPNKNLNGDLDTEEKDYRKIALYIVALLLIITLSWKFIKLLKKIILYRKENRENYRKSEAWHYKQILKNTNSADKTVNKINTWWDLARSEKHPVSVSEVLKGSEVFDHWIEMQELKHKPTQTKVKRVLKTLLASVDEKENTGDDYSINP